MEKKKQVALCFSVIRGHIPQFFPLDTIGFLEASVHGRSGLRTVVAYFAGGSASDSTFLCFGELCSEGRAERESSKKGRNSLLAPLPNSLSPCGWCDQKRGSHRGEAQRPSVLSQMCWVREAVGRQGEKFRD